MNTKLVELRKEIDAKARKLHDVWEQAGEERDLGKITLIEGDNKYKADKIKAMNTELGDLEAKAEGLAEIETMAAQDSERMKVLADGVQRTLPQPGGSGGSGPIKGLGELFVQSKAYTERTSKGGPVAELGIDLKTVMTTAAGWAPQAIRSGRMVDYATRPIQVIDLIPGGSTQQNAYVYMEETTFTNAAAEATESSGA
jgi:hypothetical protein